jgi:hypothetical protein
MGASGFVAVVALLHVLKPEIEPSWRFISEYAIGAYGWMMSTAFLAFAAAYAGLFATTRRSLTRVPGRIGAGALLISALGLAIAGIFTTDPITTAPAEATMAGTVHSIGGALGLAMPLAVVFVTWRLARDVAWKDVRSLLIAFAIPAILGFLYAFTAIALAVTSNAGRFGPGVNVGWPNRIETLLYVLWVIAVATASRKRQDAGSSARDVPAKHAT